MRELPYVKCPACGWLHIAVPRERARDDKCFRCGTSSSAFVIGTDDDAPPGATIQSVHVPDTRLRELGLKP